jgi:UTRA domain
LGDLDQAGVCPRLPQRCRFASKLCSAFRWQLNPAAVIADDLGMAGAVTFRVEGDGASGQLEVHASVARLMAGLARHVAVIGGDPCASSLRGDEVQDRYGFSFDAGTGALPTDFPETGPQQSILRILSDRFKLEWSAASEVISPVVADAEMAATFGIAEDSPLQREASLAFGYDGSTVFHEDVYRTGAVSFNLMRHARTPRHS